jgi:hypothetical protein
MFHLVAVIFLDIKAFVFNLPSEAASLVGEFFRIGAVGFEICQPGESDRLLFFLLMAEQNRGFELRDRQFIDP